jgi:hypothetical protein
MGNEDRIRPGDLFQVRELVAGQAPASLGRRAYSAVYQNALATNLNSVLLAPTSSATPKNMSFIPRYSFWLERFQPLHQHMAKSIVINVFRTWDIGDQPFAIGFFLEWARQMASIHDQAINHHHPRHWIMLHAAAQSPLHIHQANLEHLLDLAGLVPTGAFGYSKPRT